MDEKRKNFIWDERKQHLNPEFVIANKVSEETYREAEKRLKWQLEEASNGRR